MECVHGLCMANGIKKSTEKKIYKFFIVFCILCISLLLLFTFLIYTYILMQTLEFRFHLQCVIQPTNTNIRQDFPCYSHSARSLSIFAYFSSIPALICLHRRPMQQKHSHSWHSGVVEPEEKVSEISRARTMRYLPMRYNYVSFVAEWMNKRHAVETYRTIICFETRFVGHKMKTKEDISVNCWQHICCLMLLSWICTLFDNLNRRYGMKRPQKNWIRIISIFEIFRISKNHYQHNWAKWLVTSNKNYLREEFLHILLKNRDAKQNPRIE